MIILLDCGHEESPHSEITRGYATTNDGKKICYECALAADIKQLRAEGVLTAYISSDGQKITTWPGMEIAKITGKQTVNMGFRRDQISFNATMPDGTKLYGYGPGTGMFCRVKTYKNKA